MLFPRSARIPFSPSALKAFCIAVLVTTMALPLAAQVTGQPEPDTSQGTSNSSDVQTAKVVQKTPDAYKRDVAVSVFSQYTNVTNGNFIRQDVTSSGGGMVSYRQSPRWWLGYEVNYGYTGYSEAYQKGSYRVKHSANEITAAYLIKSRTYFGVQGFVSFGAGAMIFSPSTYGGPLNFTNGTPSTQALPLFVYSVGLQHTFGEHLGIRVQYRGDEYKAPNFKLVSLDTHSLRTTSEPAVGVYYRF